MHITGINHTNFGMQNLRSFTAFGNRIENTEKGNAVYNDQGVKIQDIEYGKEYVHVRDYDSQTQAATRERSISRVVKGLSYDYDYATDTLTLVSMVWPNGKKKEVSQFKGHEAKIENLQEHRSYYEDEQLKCLQKRVSSKMFERIGYDKSGNKVFSHYTEKLIFQ